MKKTNKCNVQYVCWGNRATCKYYEPATPLQEIMFNPICIYFESGYCTCKEAQKEAVE